MKDKKKLILSWTVLTFIMLVPLNIVRIQNLNIENNLKVIDNNYVYATLSSLDGDGFAYTKEEEDYIKNIEGVKNVQFVNKNQWMPHSMLDSEYVNGEAENYEGVNLLKGLHIDKNLDYIFGGEISKENGVVVSVDMAKLLVDKFANINEISELIGKQVILYNNTFEIEGIYNGGQKYQYVHINPFNSTYIYNSYNKAFYTKGYLSGNYPTLEEAILSWDQSTDWKHAVYTEEEIGGEIQSVYSYEKSIENGAKNLINPDTKIYSENYPSIAIIELESSTDKEDVVYALKNMKLSNEILTNETTVDEVGLDVTNNYYNIIILYILTMIILYTKYIKDLKYGEAVLELLQMSIISLGIGTFIFIIFTKTKLFFPIIIELFLLNLIAITIMVIINKFFHKK